ncbi:hypothetical protein TNCV_4152921 [Trichonephila clavipes]|nr:hypothetical protein TNCV_4152921 [Trichonephila clavipes]
MRARTYCAPSPVYMTIDAEVHEQMSPLGGKSEAKSPASLVLIYRPTPEGIKGPPIRFPKGHNGKVPTGRQPLLEFCLAAP